ncbi:alpha/beta fold hydrolase [Prochlorococcus sp. MIT 0801]|uniref:alpha/beta fold hydrolase n=1 Tax=Prochlorococcus sp. MIT 0801 TaxID=1501269 RepID=UPI0004F62939|nr:alpha/beta fold hydrolase [Prochlorococcus sp. MIT 0801]AIQ97754.1 putative alpha/beta hydrolase [Prochlorococcus sp. MIT 0801]
MQQNILNKESLMGSPDWGESKYWSYKDLRVHFRETGKESDPPIVLVHGFGASCDHWRNNAEIFASEGFRVFGIDLIGFGKSEQNLPRKINHLDNQFWANQLASFLDEIVDIQKNGKVILIGNSLGALTAITILSNRPELIKTIIAAPLPEPVFVNPIKFYFPNWLLKVKSFLIKIVFHLFPLKALVNLISKTKLITFALQSAYFRTISNDTALKRIVTVPARRVNASKALRAMCIGMSNRPNSAKGPSIIDKIQNLPNRPPILLIWGKQDKLIPIFLAKKLIKLHPWIKLTVINESGHCPHDELPEHFNQIVMRWLKSLKTSK